MPRLIRRGHKRPLIIVFDSFGSDGYDGRNHCPGCQRNTKRNGGRFMSMKTSILFLLLLFIFTMKR